ncbi:MAG: hypothetical protein ACK5RC_01250 [Curvibacter sp.]|jgi:hypothetical protein
MLHFEPKSSSVAMQALSCFAYKLRFDDAFFAQANSNAVIEGPARKCPATASGDYLKQLVAANFKAC